MEQEKVSTLGVIYDAYVLQKQELQQRIEEARKDGANEEVVGLEIALDICEKSFLQTAKKRIAAVVGVKPEEISDEEASILLMGQAFKYKTEDGKEVIEHIPYTDGELPELHKLLNMDLVKLYTNMSREAKNEADCHRAFLKN